MTEDERVTVDKDATDRAMNSHGLARTRVSLMAESKSWKPGDRVIVRLSGCACSGGTG